LARGERKLYQPPEAGSVPGRGERGRRYRQSSTSLTLLKKSNKLTGGIELCYSTKEAARRVREGKIVGKAKLFLNSQEKRKSGDLTIIRGSRVERMALCRKTVGRFS